MDRQPDTNLEKFPPYRLLLDSAVEDADRKTAQLVGIYRKTQTHAWNGEEMLAHLLQKHGGIHISREDREHLAKIFTVLLWGELAAWNISADLVFGLDNVEAKMAATGQVFDEARHFHTLRAYLRCLDVDLPKLDGYSTAFFRGILEEKQLAHKLYGMQVLAENLAVHTFQALAERNVEPVLSELLGYFIKDEARHVGLGIIYLPRFMERFTRMDILRFQLFEKRCTGMLNWSGEVLKPHLGALGIDYNALNQDVLKTYTQFLHELARLPEGTPAKVMAPTEEHANRFASLAEEYIDALIPPPGTVLSPGQQRVLGIIERVGRFGDEALRRLLS